MRRLVLLVSLTACKASISEGMGDASGAGDGASIDAARDAAAPLGPWSAPTPVAITPVGDDDPTATGDLLELFFNRSGNIYVTTRATTADPWSTPATVDELNSGNTETTPEVSYDGLTMYFASSRTGTIGGNDIWISTRPTRTSAWTTPVRVAELCSASDEGAVTLVDPLHAMLDSDRGGATLLDLYSAQRATPSAAWTAPVLVAELNSGQSEGNPMVASDKLSVYFDSDRSGDGELYVATRTSANAVFGAPAIITELSSPTSKDSDPWISPDGRTMFFTSDRDGTTRLWQTTR
ncbi:MAG TPA: hypothetical protein VIV40_07040 [Kofleriaceae bacterium]